MGVGVGGLQVEFFLAYSEGCCGHCWCCCGMVGIDVWSIEDNMES